MENSETTANTTFTVVATPEVSSPTSPAAASTVVLSPCAACKILRRRCIEKCVLAPYFPPTEPLKFTIAHRVFGASNIIKLLQELPEEQRADAVNSMVYEANARLRDPVYGCTGTICQLQRQISDLKAELAMAQAEVLNLQLKNGNLFQIIWKEMGCTQHDLQVEAPRTYHENSSFFLEENIFDVLDVTIQEN